MSAEAARAKNREDIERQVLLLQEAYAAVGHVVDLHLDVQPLIAGRFDRQHTTLSSVADDGSLLTITAWIAARSVDVWLALDDMRRAIEQLPR